MDFEVRELMFQKCPEMISKHVWEQKTCSEAQTTLPDRFRTSWNDLEHVYEQ